MARARSSSPDRGPHRSLQPSFLLRLHQTTRHNRGAFCSAFPRRYLFCAATPGVLHVIIFIIISLCYAQVSILLVPQVLALGEPGGMCGSHTRISCDSRDLRAQPCPARIPSSFFLTPDMPSYDVPAKLPQDVAAIHKLLAEIRRPMVSPSPESEERWTAFIEEARHLRPHLDRLLANVTPTPTPSNSPASSRSSSPEPEPVCTFARLVHAYMRLLT